jgi:NADH-quinone oxidoreductase subunit N
VTITDLVLLFPILVLAAAAVGLLLVIAFFRSHKLTAGSTLVGLALALVSLPFVSGRGPHQVTALLRVDDYSLFYTGLILAATFVVVALSYPYLEKHQGHHEEFYVLLLLAALGSSVLVSSSHFASFFLGLEILSVSIYALAAYLRVDLRGIEAGMKYLILAGASSAFLLFGMALVYAQTGTMEFARMADLRATPGAQQNALLLTGLGMLVIGVGFKLALVPFHMWTPDVYQGAPAPVTAFIATVSKGAVFALLLRYFNQVDVHAFNSLFVVFAVIALASMFAGNLLALLQSNVKRLLAYSSIAHLGYLLVAFLVGGSYAAMAVTFYLVAYFVTTLTTFGTVSVLSGPDGDADLSDDYLGLFWRQPWLAGVFTAALLSLAGIPLTAGFVGKFYILSVGVGSALWLLVIGLVVSSAIGLYYYLRLIVTMYLEPSPARRESVSVSSRLSGGSLALAALAVLLVWWGIYPTPLITIVQRMVAGLG